MAGPLDALERFMEEAVEGTAQRLFRPALQPVQLAKAAAREMESGQYVGPAGPEVPNHYTIALHPGDFERFARFQVALQRELAGYLDTHARERGWRPVSDIVVMLEVDGAVPRGRLRVLAQMLDTAAPAAGPRGALGAQSIEATVRQRAVPAPARRSLERAGAVLVGPAGERFVLSGPLVRIGRALENDVVIEDSRVSRFHAEIRREAERYLVRDLGSTNGTLVAEEPVEESELREGDTLSLGGYALTFRQLES